MKAIHHDLLQEGRTVPWTKLCAVLERRIKELIETQAAFGIRSVWAWLRFVDGLVFGSRLYCSTVRRYGLKQEYIAPYTPEQNGRCERFIRTLKEQCVWLHRFSSLQHARAVIANWITQYNTIRPHQSLDYLSPIKHLNSLLCTQQAA